MALKKLNIQLQFTVTYYRLDKLEVVLELGEIIVQLVELFLDFLSMNQLGLRLWYGPD